MRLSVGATYENASFSPGQELCARKISLLSGMTLYQTIITIHGLSWAIPRLLG